MTVNNAFKLDGLDHVDQNLQILLQSTTKYLLRLIADGQMRVIFHDHTLPRFEEQSKVSRRRGAREWEIEAMDPETYQLRVGATYSGAWFCSSRRGSPEGLRLGTLSAVAHPSGRRAQRAGDGRQGGPQDAPADGFPEVRAHLYAHMRILSRQLKCSWVARGSLSRRFHGVQSQCYH